LRPPVIDYHLFRSCVHHRDLHSFPTRRSSDLITANSTLRPAGKVPGAGTHRKPNRLPTESPTVPRSSVSPAAEVNVYCLPLSEIDRKSTRLNSSHDQISYAVFCLKKKSTTPLT